MIANLVWPGLGHFALGRYWRGAFWMMVATAACLLVPLSLLFLWIGLAAPRVLSVVDAALVRMEIPPPTGNQVMVAFLLGLGALAAIGAATSRYYIEGYRSPSAGMAPTLAIGDHFFLNKVIYRYQPMARGDVIVFVNPCQPETTFVKRLVALPGDSIEVRCDIIYLNGKPVPKRLLHASDRYWDYSPGNPWEQMAASRYVERLDGHEYEVFHDAKRPERDASRNWAGGAERDFPVDTIPTCDVYENARSKVELGRIERAPASDAAAGPPAACAPRQRYVVPDGHVFVIGDNRENSSDSRAWGPVPISNILGRAFAIWWSAGAPAEGIRWDRVGALR